MTLGCTFDIIKFLIVLWCISTQTYFSFSKRTKYTSVTSCLLPWTNRIYHWSLMQSEIFQPEGKWIMPEKRFPEFPALSVVGISRSASMTND